MPVRRLADGKLEVLLITSRETRRWIIPKGWPWPDRPNSEAAAAEAWEEAGVRGRARSEQIGTYTYDKQRPDAVLAVEVEVYLLEVTELEDAWPEAVQRERAWFSPEDAAAAVDEPELQTLLRKLTA